MTQKTNLKDLKPSIIGVVVGLALIIITITSVLFLRGSDSISSIPNVVTNTRLEAEVLSLIAKESINSVPSQEALNEGRLKGVVDAMGDPYSVFVPAREEEEFNNTLNQRYQGVGIRFDETDKGFVVDRVFQSSPAQEGGVQVGDLLIKVDNTAVVGQTLANVAEQIRGEEETTVELVFDRNGQQYTTTLTRRRIQTDLVYLTIKENLAVVEISSFGNDLDKKMNDIATQIKNNSQIKYLVLDVRGNSGGLLNESVDVLSYFLPENSIVLREKTRDGEKTIYSEYKANSLQDYPLVVWIDNNSASASEIAAGALRDIRQAKIIGETSFGKGTVQRIFSLSSGDKVRLTIAEWITPNRSEINKKGVEPDFPATTLEQFQTQTLQYFTTIQV